MFLFLCSLQLKIMPTPRLVSFMFSSRWIVFSASNYLCSIESDLFAFAPCWCLTFGSLQAAALAFYILSALFFNSFVIIFVVTVLLSALDFWVVKNVSGRILVGLRWWNEINDLGESVWRFECLDQEVSALFNQTVHLLSDITLPSLSIVCCCLFALVVGSDEQERFMAVLVDPLPFSKFILCSLCIERYFCVPNNQIH